MRRSTTLVAAVAFAAAVLCSSHAQARDWFVRAGAEAGDGSYAKPFADPWQALEKAANGDRIHVAEGRYVGKLDSGNWVVSNKVELLGGYTADFKSRDPWAHPTLLDRPKDSKAPRVAWRLEGDSRGNPVYAGAVVDGFVFDLVGVNEYKNGEVTKGLEVDPPTKLARGAMTFADPVTIRNNVIVNTSTTALLLSPGSTVENNLIVNSVRAGISIRGSGATQRTLSSTVRRNTIVFTWDHRAPGEGGPNGMGIDTANPIVVQDNILAHNDNHGIYVGNAPLNQVEVKGNVFGFNLYSNMKFFLDKDVAIDDKGMDMFEDVGLKASDGNAVLDPQLPLDKDWMDLYSKRTSAQRGKVTMDDWNQLRRSLGLPLVAAGGKSAEGVAPAWDWKKALALMAPGNSACKAGARRLALEAKVDTSAAPATAALVRDYEKSELSAWSSKPQAMDGKAVEVVVAIGGVSSINGVVNLPGVTPKTHEASNLYMPDGSNRVLIVWERGTPVAKAVDEAIYNGGYNGSGKATRLYTVRGIAKAVDYGAGRPKPGLLVESIEPAGAPAAASAPRPVGRDWFVRAGASGGDGSREKPFKDPFQALEKAAQGDVIHVAEGEYGGKLKSGRWKVTVPYVTLRGGYDKDFTSRDPWKRPTLLAWPGDGKGTGGGETLSGDGDHTGTIVDGFVFDKVKANKYKDDGDIKPRDSDVREHVVLTSPKCEVRNCTFLNGSLGGAVRLATPVVVENNLFLNHVWSVIRIEGAGQDPTPSVVRRNTVLFSWTEKPGDPEFATGHALELSSNVRAIIDANVFQFADNSALRGNAYPKDLELTDNVFSHNLLAHYLFQAKNPVTNENFKQLCDLGFKKCSGNQVVNPEFALDPGWFDVYVKRSAYQPGKVTMDDWNKLRELMGQPLLAKGGTAARGFAPAYDAKKAIGLVPRNAACKAGARPESLPVVFTK